MIDVVTTAARRADDEALMAMARARVDLPNAPEYIVSGDATGKRLIIPVKALATGMLAHIERAYAKNHRP